MLPRIENRSWARAAAIPLVQGEHEVADPAGVRQGQKGDVQGDHPVGERRGRRQGLAVRGVRAVGVGGYSSTCMPSASTLS